MTERRATAPTCSSRLGAPSVGETALAPPAANAGRPLALLIGLLAGALELAPGLREEDVVERWLMQDE
jgi:hypothetical protein